MHDLFENILDNAILENHETIEELLLRIDKNVESNMSKISSIVEKNKDLHLEELIFHYRMYQELSEKYQITHIKKH